jgi:hypothetical protein
MTIKYDPNIKPPVREGMSAKTDAVCALINAGRDPAEAYAIINPDKKPLTKANKYELKKKANALALEDPKRVKAAQKAIDLVLAGKKVGDVKSINTSDVIAAVKMIADRIDPIVNQSLNINANVKISPVDLSAYLNKEV